MRNNRKLKNGNSHYSNGNELDIFTLKNSSKGRKLKLVNYTPNSAKSYRKNAKTVGLLKFETATDIAKSNDKDKFSVPSQEKEITMSEVVNQLSKSLDRESISNDVQNSNSGLHTLFHYIPNQRVEKISYEKDKCPVCNYLKRQRIQSTDAVLESRFEPNSDFSIKSDRYRVKSASEGSEPKMPERVSSYSSEKLSFTFEFSNPADNDSSESAFCNGISVDLTNCKNVSFRVEKLSGVSSRHYSSSLPSIELNNSLLSAALSQKQQNVANQHYGSTNFSINSFSSLSLRPYLSVLIPNSLKKCFFCQSNLTFCYECRKTPPSFFSNYNYSCSSCKVCNYNEYSDLVSKSACVIAEPIQSSRINDIFDSLKTCLIPQRFLNYYKIVAPPNRNWHIIEEPSDGMSFTLMCYNVLCQKYATTHMYPYCPAFALDWEYRKRGILEEIWKYKADIICLQELETSQFENVFYLELRKRNYEGLFVPKSRSRTMHESDSKCVDGCAIFWKVECFEKVHHVTHEFMLSCIGVSKNPAPELLNRVMNRDNVALSIILEAKDPKMNKRKLCVSTGHIHWDPEYSDVKLIQTLFWSSELWNYIRDYFQAENMPYLSPSEMPVILCGDFNSLPDSGVVDYLIKGEVECSHVDFRDFGDKYLFNEWSAIQEEFVENDVLKHRFNFDRAYKDENESGLKWTNYTYDFRGIIDYIFFSKSHLNLLGNLKQIPESWFEQQKIVGAPHVHFNSDHFSLLVELELKNLSSPSVGQQQQQQQGGGSILPNSSVPSSLVSSGGSSLRQSCGPMNNSNISSNSQNNNNNSINNSSSSPISLSAAITTTAYPYRGQSTWS